MSESDRESRSSGIRVTVSLYEGAGNGDDGDTTTSATPGRRRKLAFVPTDVDFATLIGLVASRLGVNHPPKGAPASASQVDEESSKGGAPGTKTIETTASWRLLLGGDAVLEDVAEIDDGDEIVLDTGGDAIVIKSSESGIGDGDDDDETNGANGSAHDGGVGFSDNPRDGSESDSSVVDVTDQCRPQPSSDDDDGAVEDVTEEFRVAAEEERRQKLEEAELLEDDDDGADESTEEETSGPECIVLSSDDSDDDDDDESWSGGESRKKPKRKQAAKRKRATGKRKKKDSGPAAPTIEVIIDEGDVPNMPGAKGNETASGDAADDSPDEKNCDNDNVDASIKDRVIKLLNTGFHSNSNEHEARNALKLARRLMARHNLSQALLLQQRDGQIRSDGAASSDGSPLRGGLVTVRIVKRANREPLSALVRWNDRLIHPVCENFQIEAYKTVRRKRRWRQGECSITFYGIYDNAQLAAYAFKIATERIASMAAAFVPVSSARSCLSSTEKATATKVARLSYALGIVEGLARDVEENKKREEQRREERLKRARSAASKGEAYEESDGEGDDNYGGGWSDSEGGEADAPFLKDPEASGSSRGHSLEKAPDAPAEPQDAKVVVEKLEREECATLALVEHHKRIAKDVLKDKNIKVRKGRKRQRIAFDRTAYDKGVEDSKEIDLNQRAIQD